jgi:hypothetical protein
MMEKLLGSVNYAHGYFIWTECPEVFVSLGKQRCSKLHAGYQNGDIVPDLKTEINKNGIRTRTKKSCVDENYNFKIHSKRVTFTAANDM